MWGFGAVDEGVALPESVWLVHGWQWHSAQWCLSRAGETRRLRCQAQAPGKARGPDVIGHRHSSQRTRAPLMRYCHLRGRLRRVVPCAMRRPVRRSVRRRMRRLVWYRAGKIRERLPRHVRYGQVRESVSAACGGQYHWSGRRVHQYRLRRECQQHCRVCFQAHQRCQCCCQAR